MEKEKKETAGDGLSGYHRSIRNWPEGERPREKALMHGLDALSDAELLSIAIHSGTKGASAIDIARNLIIKYGSLRGISRRSINELTQEKGIGQARSANILSSFELGRRCNAGSDSGKITLTNPKMVANRYGPLLRDLPTERFLALLLNNSSVLIKEVVISTGTVNASLVHPREVYKAAVLELATSIVLVHNHPSGSRHASKEDHIVTKQLVDAGRMMDIPVNDHIIICGYTYISFVENGWL
jgi:DNA repair protein RadC